MCARNTFEVEKYQTIKWKAENSLLNWDLWGAICALFVTTNRSTSSSCLNYFKSKTIRRCHVWDCKVLSWRPLHQLYHMVPSLICDQGCRQAASAVLLTLYVMYSLQGGRKRATGRSRRGAAHRRLDPRLKSRTLFWSACCKESTHGKPCACGTRFSLSSDPPPPPKSGGGRVTRKINRQMHVLILYIS